MTATIEPIIGRYVRLNLGGVERRVYVEQAGTGIPLLCLHTAGADGRQYRHLLNDPAVLDRFQVTTFDMPWHGKSSPGPGWRDTEYQLSASDYADMIYAVIEAMSLDRPIVMGCSIGGRIVLKLARDNPERFRALIGLQSGPHVAPYYDRGYLHRPDVHEGELCVALMSGLFAPDADAANRDETLWHYAQSGPGVFKGDLSYYKDDGDDDANLARIDTTRCPLYLLTGEYDYSCMPEDTEYLASKISGTKAVIMSDLGHFPMSEDYQKFIPYLAPVLDDIAAAG